jgi:[ribosomal protein S5]-alanine N-acetyltransferase
MDIVSERLSYHKFTLADIGDYLSWYTHDEVMKHITGRGLTKPEAEARFKIALGINEQYADAGFYAVRKRGADLFIGIAKFVFTETHEAEVGYGMLPEYWGKGYASEILDCMVKNARKHHRITKLVAIVNPENHASKKVLAKKGFALYKEEALDGKMVEYHKLAVHQTHP